MTSSAPWVEAGPEAQELVGRGGARIGFRLESLVSIAPKEKVSVRSHPLLACEHCARDRCATRRSQAMR